MKTRIVLIDDQSLFRQGIKFILNQEPSFEVVGEGSDGKQAVSLIETLNPDVVIMDVNKPIMNGIGSTSLIMQVRTKTKVIILSSLTDKEVVIESLRAGAVGYMIKDMDFDSLLSAIKEVVDGRSYLHPSVTSYVINDFFQLENSNVYKDRFHQLPFHLLTRRECDVLQLLANGHSNQGIANQLLISDKTVKNHVSKILLKMNCTDRTQAVIKAIKNSWVKLS